MVNSRHTKAVSIKSLRAARRSCTHPSTLRLAAYGERHTNSLQLPRPKDTVNILSKVINNSPQCKINSILPLKAVIRPSKATANRRKGSTVRLPHRDSTVRPRLKDSMALLRLKASTVLPLHRVSTVRLRHKVNTEHRRHRASMAHPHRPSMAHHLPKGNTVRLRHKDSMERLPHRGSMAHHPRVNMEHRRQASMVLRLPALASADRQHKLLQVMVRKRLLQ